MKNKERMSKIGGVIDELLEWGFEPDDVDDCVFPFTFGFGKYNYIIVDFYLLNNGASITGRWKKNNLNLAASRINPHSLWGWVVHDWLKLAKSYKWIKIDE